MSTALAVTNVVSMSSREIAELTGKQHRHVMRDIRDMLSSLYEGKQDDYLPRNILENQQSPNLGSAVSAKQYGVNNANQPVYEYTLDQDHTINLLTGYDAKARMRVIKRWRELEEQAARRHQFIAESQSYWKSVRYDLAASYNKMVQIIEAICRRDGLSEEDTLHMKWREADLLNFVVMGMSSADIRAIYDIKRPIRNSFPNKILMAYHVVENHNISMLVGGVPFETRKAGLEYLLGTEFPDVVKYRNAQMERIKQCRANKDWSAGPTHPKDWPSMRIPNEIMLRYNILPEELEASAQLMLEGEY